MAFNYRSGTPADGSITSAKLADGSVITQKLAPSAVDVTKVTTDLATESFLGSEASIFVTGTVETQAADFNFTTGTSNADNWKKLSYSIKLASDNVSHTASAKIYIDTVQYGTTQTTTSITPVIKSEFDLDISALSAGSHHFELKLLSDNAVGTATVSQTDVYLGKK